MSAQFATYAETIRRLNASLIALEDAAHTASVPPLAGREWWELLQRKLIPQLSDEAYLVVAVVGGTNIGKSVIFNHLAGTQASATSPLASGTKHPVCLISEGFDQQHDLSAVFPGFQLIEWNDPAAALEETDEHRLFWRASPDCPDNLLILDTPDIDSDARINWERADHIRRSADLLIAVLTQQKYNDAAVKAFFRKAAEEDKAVIVVFNQCLLPEDEEFWPRWLDTFCTETRVEPEWIYVAPNDRRAAESLKLSFFERSRPGTDEPDDANRDLARSLLEDLSRLRFGEVKVRALRGAMQHLVDETEGVPAYLREIRQACREFASAAELLTANQLAEVKEWPTVPNPLLIGEIRTWWQQQRTGWTGQVHGAYNALGRGLTWPFRAARQKLKGETRSAWEIYQEREWSAVLTAIEKVYSKLTFLTELGNDVLKPRLERALAGTSRSALIERVRSRHRELDLQQELHALVARELAGFREESPRHYEFFRRIDMAAAAARPATSVILFVTGFAPVGEVIAPVVADSAMQGALHVAGDVAGGTLTAAVGDTVLSEGAASGTGYLEAKFRRLHAGFAAQRAAWLAGMLSEHLLGTLPTEVQAAAAIPQSEPFTDVTRLMGEIRESLATVPASDTEPQSTGQSVSAE
ncbi:MAG: hypothetical protein DWQ34_10715 [Planctomycetota bacterium]|nr:MAG: hypothetical protein DWQ29_11730 [Planctomycetota bacterium]REJ93379.1 MAG: hypothetical protein DWQ34_10715 [Planctomycetota bacterium]REK20756.1 MAG: hypothetical protein DWQ41_24235 [Planctomycetota bacterium]REK38062.1 MAG: hypothetical protein DWQ45_05315 [Planctomycetota bacterium]